MALAFCGRLFSLQIINGEEFVRQADRQYLRSSTTFFNRGSIYFTNRDGTLVPAATLNQAYPLSINPQLINSPESTYQDLSQFIDLDKERFISQAEHPTRVYIKIKDDLGQETASEISALGLRGVSIQNKKERFYPAENLASHTLGFMAYNNDVFAGQYGLEKYYDEVLDHGQVGTFASYFSDTFLRPAQNIFASDQSKKEGDLILTLEPVIQNKLENTMSDVVEKRQASGAGAIIMDPGTGDIIAMTAKPDFNPGHPQADISLLTNPLIERVFEMGSTVKALTIAAGLDAGVIKRDDTYNDLGQVTINNRTMSNHDRRARGVVDMQTVLNHSLNTGAIHIMQKMGQDKFRDYFLGFGLGEPTGIDLPGEVGGLVNNLYSSREVEYATASFGQGIALTPMGSVRAFGALANNGQLVKPRSVKAIRDKNGQIREREVVNQGQVISRQAADEITTMLVNAVDEALLGGQAALDRYSVAAKTGTAQMPLTDRRGYDPDRYLHAFFGYYPAYDPRFVGYFYLINPKEVRWASDSLTEPFMETAKFILDYYEVPPDR